MNFALKNGSELKEYMNQVKVCQSEHTDDFEGMGGHLHSQVGSWVGVEVEVGTIYELAID